MKTLYRNSCAFMRRKTVMQASMISFLFAWVLAVMLAMSSCQSPVNIDTPRDTKPDIVWQTLRNADGTIIDKVATVNNVEPEVSITLTRNSWILSPQITTATVSETAFFNAYFQNADPNRSMTITADGPNYQNYPVRTLNDGLSFFLAPYIVVSDVNTATPLQVNTVGYALGDNKLEWLGKVEITSHRTNHFQPTLRACFKSDYLAKRRNKSRIMASSTKA